METLTGLQGAKLSEAAYSGSTTVEGYTLISLVSNPFINFDTGIFTGFQVALYKDLKGNYVIAFAGTDSILDGITDVSMGIHTLIDGVTSQFMQGEAIVSKWINDYPLSPSNTTIVGHSLGGALAQYFGAKTQFETLTYNAYGIGNEISGGSNITNYITMHDPVCILPQSEMIGTTYMLQDENLTAMLGHGISNFTSESSWVRGYSPVDDPGDVDAIIGTSLYELALMAIEGRAFAMINGSMDDFILGGEKYNLLIGGSGKDTLYGMGGSDNLQGGKGDDTLYGGNKDEDDGVFDALYGGEGFDTYIAGDSDIIFDEDGNGEVYFDETLLTGGKKEAGSGCEPTEDDGSSVYKGNGGTYTLSGDTLTFERGGETLTILNFSSGKLGITLEESGGGGNDCPPPGSGGGDGSGSGHCPSPINPLFSFHFHIPVPVSPPASSKSGDPVNIVHHSVAGSSIQGKPLIPGPTYAQCVNHPNYNSAGAGGGGGSTGPIVLDLNHDGITSISIAASIALFDYDGDGIKENTAWIQSTDALLVNDVNNDGLINDASELFGNYTRNSDGSIAKGGYQALSYYDSSKDNIIDANDERFGELKVWVDSDGDGVTDDGELKTLSELGITSLSINTSTPYMATAEETNTIIQETTFTDSQGEGIMRDVLFRYENNSEPADGVYFDMDGNGIKEKMTTWTDPNQWMVVRDINGDGKITSGREVVGNHMILNDGTTAPDTIQALKTFDINHDGVIDASDNSGLAFWTDRNHNGLTDVGELEALGAAGAIQVIKLNPYQTLLSGYDNGDGVINNSDQIYNYLYIQTNSDDTITLYLPDNDMARSMIQGYTGGESIQTADGEKIVKEVLFYEGYEMDLNDTLVGTDDSETLLGSSRGETISGMGGRDIIDAGAGNDIISGGAGSDKLLGGEGNDTYVYAKSDGKDLIIDYFGDDNITFSEGITKDDIIIKSNGSDISIYIKDGDKPLLELTDQIIIKDWYSTDSIETINFSNGISIDKQDITALIFANNNNYTIYGTDESDVINAFDGDDILIGNDGDDVLASGNGNDYINGGAGDDFIDGGAGNDEMCGREGDDTYIFGHGSGHDIIYDEDGFDTLLFKEGITAEDLIIERIEDSIIIGLKEDGKQFDELSDKVTLSSCVYDELIIENIVLDDGTVIDISELLSVIIMGNVAAVYGSDGLVAYPNTNNEMNNGGWTIDYGYNIWMGNGNDIVYGASGDDNISGEDGNDTLYGYGGNDYIYGGKGDDILIGGKGNDYIYDEYGNDTYTYSKGDGQDLVYDWSGYDTFKFGIGITADDLIIKRVGNSLEIGIKEDGKNFDELSDKIILGNYYWNFEIEEGKIENILLSDGAIVDLIPDNLTISEGSDYIELGYSNNIVDALSGDDYVIGNGGNDTIYGNGGNDKIFGDYGDDKLYGDSGNDYIDGGSGNNTLIGGQGNDTLDGYWNNDTYIYSKGDGQDLVSDWGGYDTFKFGIGITTDDLIIKRVGYSLIIAIKEDGKSFDELNDKITFYGYFYGSDQYKIENFILADGTQINIPNIPSPSNEDDVILNFSVGGEYIYGLGGNDEIADYCGYNTIIGGPGNDTILDYVGNDVFLFNRGDGKDVIENYQSTNIIRFADGISADDLVMQLDGSNLIIGLKETGKAFDELSDSVTIYGWNWYSQKMENIVLNDGTKIDTSYYLLPTEGNDVLMVHDLDGQTIDGSGGNDNITGGSGDDILIGGSGDDFIFGGSGDDILIGGSGNDFIYGGDGNDEYLFSRGDGLDYIHESNETDTLEFGDGITQDDLILQRDGNDLMIGLKEDGKTFDELSDKVTWYNYWYYENPRVENIIFNDGVHVVINVNHSIIIYADQNEVIASNDGNFSDSFDDFTTDSTIKIDSIESMQDSDISSFTLQSRYTGSGLDGASAQTVFEGVGYTGTLSNIWLQSDTLDTQYTYNGTLSDEVKGLPNIGGQGNVINLQEAMNEQPELVASVEAFQSLSETGNLADFEANIDKIIEEWALYDLSGETANSTPPIVFDLDGDGITSQALTNSAAYFDYNGDGRREHTAWTDAGDALLVVDIDKNGVITKGTELFGNYSVLDDGTRAMDGYEAMSQYDSNGDNILDASDEEFSELKLWKDINQNGKNDEGELSTLAENGIIAINLSRTNGTTFTQITEAGNIVTNETNYIGTNGDGIVRDVWFSYDGTDTIAYSALSDSDEKKIAIVENFYGRRLSIEERNSVEVIAEVLDQYNALRYDTIAKIITDKLYGDMPNCSFLHYALNNTLSRVVDGIASTTETLLSVNLLASLLKREYASVLSDINHEYFSNPTIANLLSQSNIAIGFEDGALVGHIGNQYFGSTANESYDFSALDGVRAYMGAGDDFVMGTNGIDEIVGGEGNDILNGKSGNDVLEGGQGNDTLIGAASQNVYRYSWGDGNDTIIDAGSDDNAPDTLRLTNIDISRVSIERIGDDMVIHIYNEKGELLTPFGDVFGTITIKDGYTTGKIEHFYFEDQRYTFDEVLAYVPADTDYYYIKGDGKFVVDDPGGYDTIYFGEDINSSGMMVKIVGSDMMIGLAQNGYSFDSLRDVITIKHYTDAIENFTLIDGSNISLDDMVALAEEQSVVSGTESDDIIYGTDYSDIFDGGAGNDTIYGEYGDDIYRFGIGDGNDIIYDVSGFDSIVFKDGVLVSDVIISLDEEDLLVSLSDGSTIRIISWLSMEDRIENIKDAQGTSVDFSSVLKPVVKNTTVETNEDNPLEGSLSVTDISGTPLVYSIATNAEHGTLTLDSSTGKWTYTPSENFNGNDSVAISVTNGYGVTSTSTIAINVLSENDIPTIEEDVVNVILRNTFNSEGQIIANDVDGDTLIYSIETETAHGLISIDENGKWQYTAEDGYDGEDSAIIGIDDGNGGIVYQTLNFNIIDNIAPEATLEVNNTLQDIRAISGIVDATDADDDILTYAVSTPTSHGTLSVDENGTWSYIATDGYIGNDSGIITIDDGNGGIVTQTLNFEINVSSPVLSDSNENLFEDNNAILALNVINPIGGILTYEILDNPRNGIISINGDSSYSYTPNQDYNGSDSVTIKVTNEYGLTDTATLTLNVQAVNDAPVATDDIIQAVEDIPFISTVSLVANDSDIDGDNLSIVAGIFTTTQGGSIDIKADGSYTYTPSTNFNGVDTFEYTLTDGELTDTATLTLNVQAVNDAPVAQNATATLNEDTVLNGILPIASDVDGDSLTYTLETDSSHGKVVINSNGSYSYTPNSNYYGTDSFVYLVSDGNGGQTTATINLTINPIIDDMTIYGTRKNDILRGDQIDVGSNDTIYGLNGNDTIYGLGGNDIIDGGNGSDNVYGGDGNDIIYASLGRDYLDGGSGIDTISYANYTHGVVETLNSNTFISYILGNARNTNFENLEGSNYSDILTGDSQNNTIYGLNGNDTLYGGKGDDTLIGGNGKDILYGGAGNDIFVIDSLNKSDIDSILDFSSKDDTIYLDNSIFTSLINEGTLDSSNFVSNKSGNAIDSDDYLVYETDTGKLFYDADGNGNGASIQIATLYGLSNQNTLTYSDFTII